jgi:adiponectin receptor
LRRRRRSSAASISSAISDVVQQVEHKVEQALSLLGWDDLPSWRRDNAYITSGYRADRNSYASSARSVFRLHNETVNIWSHLLGALISIAGAVYLYCVIKPRHESATTQDVAVFACFFAGAVICLGMSATYHALLDHSEDVAKWGNKLDYTGIVALIVGSYAPALYYGFYCQPRLMTMYMFLVCSLPCTAFATPSQAHTHALQISGLGVGCAMVSWVERFRTPELRPYRAAMFIALGGAGVVPVIHGLTLYGWQGLEDRMSLSWVIANGASNIFGAILYAVSTLR